MYHPTAYLRKRQTCQKRPPPCAAHMTDRPRNNTASAAACAGAARQGRQGRRGGATGLRTSLIGTIALTYTSHQKGRRVLGGGGWKAEPVGFRREVSECVSADANEGICWARSCWSNMCLKASRLVRGQSQIAMWLVMKFHPERDCSRTRPHMRMSIHPQD